MTTEQQQDPIDDAISQAQQELDQEQSVDQPQSVSMDQFNQLTQQLGSVQSQLSGLQGFMNKSADAIRRDVSQDVQNRFASLESDMGRKAFLSGIDDPQERERTEMIFQEMDRRMPAQSQPTTGAPSQQEASAAPQQTWDTFYSWLEKQGVSRDDPMLNYQALNSGDTATFLFTVGQAVQAKVQAKSATQPARRAPAQTASPPVEGPGANAQANNLDQLYDLLLTGKITGEQYKERLETLGVS